MRNTLVVVSAAAMIAAALSLYAIKYDAGLEATRLATLTAKVEAAESEIALLKAEKANLTRPARIERLAKALPRLRPLQPGQLGSLDALPWKDATPGETGEAPPLAPKS